MRGAQAQAQPQAAAEPPIERMYRVSQVAEMLAISPSEVRRLAKLGELPCLRVGQRGKRAVVLFPASYLRNFVEGLKQRAQAERARWGRG